MRGWHKPWTGAAASRAVGACSNASRAGGAAAATAGFCSWHGCRNTCVVVNTWLLMTVGTLLPLLVAWAFEERSRLHFVEGWLGRFMPGGSGSNRGNFDSGTATGGSTTDGGSSSSERRAPQAGWRPVPVLALAAWLLATTWALWMLMDVLLLPV